MNENVISVKKVCAVLLGVYTLFAVAFCLIAQYQMKYTAEETVFVGENADSNVGELLDGTRVVQTFSPDLKYLRGMNIRFSTFARENTGKLDISLINVDTDEALWKTQLDVNELEDNSWLELRFDEPVIIEEGSDTKLGVCIDVQGSTQGRAVTIGCQQAGVPAKDSLTINGEIVDNAGLCLSTIQNSDSKYAPFYIPLLALGLALLAAYCGWLIAAEKKGRRSLGLKLIQTVNRYNFLLKQLISRDFKTKYKRSVLGVFWSFLNPLLTMLVQYAVFSRLFKFDIKNYPVYLLTGIVFFNNFNDSTNQAMMAIVGNSQLITKVYVPKYIYPISKVLSTSINLLLSLIPLVLVALVTGVKLSPALIMLPVGILLLLLFTIGIAFAVSAAMVFFRDIQFLWGVFIMIWMYATPIIYPIEILKGSFMYPMQKLNPMYHYITFFRTIIIDGVSPEPSAYVICGALAVLSLLIGGLIFKKTQDKFVLYI
ncbi:MAG: ABC transporter permease [Lachnospiraceae bacterium]|nr:ABC transporter permease [Lachnospiraceae bacterium]